MINCIIVMLVRRSIVDPFDLPDDLWILAEIRAVERYSFSPEIREFDVHCLEDLKF